MSYKEELSLLSREMHRQNNFTLYPQYSNYLFHVIGEITTPYLSGNHVSHEVQLEYQYFSDDGFIMALSILYQHKFLSLPIDLTYTQYEKRNAQSLSLWISLFEIIYNFNIYYLKEYKKNINLYWYVLPKFIIHNTMVHTPFLIAKYYPHWNIVNKACQICICNNRKYNCNKIMNQCIYDLITLKTNLSTYNLYKIFTWLFIYIACTESLIASSTILNKQYNKEYANLINAKNYLLPHIDMF